MDRKLVTVRTISDIKPHPNADRLELATVDGWQVVVGRNEFTIGDSVLFFEVDSLIPVTEDFEFLRKYCYIKKHWLAGLMPNAEAFRIRTIRLRGQVSQGLIVPIADKFYGMTVASDLSGTSLDELFGVIKYEVPEKVPSLCGKNPGRFPDFIPKTKQVRVQNIPKGILQESYDTAERFEVTRKYHGMPTTVYAKINHDLDWFDKILLSAAEFFCFMVKPKYVYGICSHNVELDTTDEQNLFIRTVADRGIIEGLNAVIDAEYEISGEYGEFAIQAELCGPTVQKNHHGFATNNLIIFDVFDITNQRYLLPREREEFVEKMRIATDYQYPFLEATTEYFNISLPTTDVNTLVSMGEFKLSSTNENEGLVWKSMERDFSFKAISRDFLLKED